MLYKIQIELIENEKIEMFELIDMDLILKQSNNPFKTYIMSENKCYVIKPNYHRNRDRQPRHDDTTHKCANTNKQSNHTVTTRWATKAHMLASNVIAYAVTNVYNYCLFIRFLYLAVTWHAPSGR